MSIATHFLIFIGVFIIGLALLLALFRYVREGLETRRDRHFEHFINDSTGFVRHLWIKGKPRRFYLHLPENHPADKLSLVMAFHGGRGNALRFSRQTGFNVVADKYGFAVVYPEALGAWNDGRAELPAKIDDVAFVRVLIKHLIESIEVDPNRIFATGASNGGMFTMRLACEMADEISAFAPVMASMPANLYHQCRPGRPVPLMMINGTEDPFVPWEGGEIGRGRLGIGGKVLSVPDTVAFWAHNNGCWSAARVGREIASSVDDGTHIDILRYPHSAGGENFTLVRINGGGHSWPGSPIGLESAREILIGRTTSQFTASEMIWDFFCQQESNKEAPKKPDYRNDCTICM